MVVYDAISSGKSQLFFLSFDRINPRDPYGQDFYLIGRRFSQRPRLLGVPMKIEKNECQISNIIHSGVYSPMAF